MAADDDYGSDWGDDPFSGDMNFDADFDSPAKQGFLRSVTSGFLKGLVDKTIGDTDARIDTLKMILPNTYLGAFSAMTELNRRRQELLTEIKGNTYESVKDLQYLAGRVSAKLRQSGSNRIGGALDEFSKNDFSDWEDNSGREYSTTDQMEQTSDEDVADALRDADANSLMERETLIGVAEGVTGMMANVGGRTLAQLGSLGNVGVRTNQLLEQVVDYQRRVQARNDAMKLNILTRTYLTNAKYYKFSEASNHRIVAELKEITKQVTKSDYEKTTHSQAVRKSIRESVFSTVKSNIGGIAGFVDDKFGKNARGEATGVLGELTSAIRMAVEMSEGSDINYGELIGSAAAGMFIKSLPKVANSSKAKELLDKFRTNFPEKAKWAEEAYARITDLGNVATYNLSNAEGLGNTLARHYNGGYSFDEFEDYEEYVDSLQPGQEPLKKFEWTILNTARKTGNSLIGGVLDNVSDPGGSQYTLQKRTIADSRDPELWNKRDSRTLTEEIPRWFAQIHLSLEKLRTGNDDLKPMSYDYVKGTFLNQKQKVAEAINKVFDKGQFSTQAEVANRFAEDLDADNALTPEAKKALAFALVKDSDSKMGFSPYNYMHGEKQGMTPAVAEEIKRLMQGQFGITDDHIERFVKGTPVDQALLLANLPTEEGRAKAARAAVSSKSLGQFATDVSNNFDLLRANGYDDALKESGIMGKKDGNDVIDRNLILETVKAFIEDPKRASAEPVPNDPDLPSRPFGGGPTPPVPPVPPVPPIPAFRWPAMPKFKWPELPKFPAWADLPKFPDWPDLPKWPDYPEFKWPAFPTMPAMPNWPAMPKLPDFPSLPEFPKIPTPDAGPVPPATVNVNGMDKLVESFEGINGLKEGIDGLGKILLGNRETKGTLDWTPVTTGFEELSKRIDSLITLGTARNVTLDNILLRQPKGAAISESDEKVMEEEKKGILDRLKSTNFKELFNGSINKILDHQPLVLGGLLGGLAGLAVYNPKAAALLAGGAAVAVGYGKLRSLANARSADSSEDLYEEGVEDPILEASKLKRGDYLDMTTGFILETWDKITGSVKDITNGVVIGARRLQAKLFTADNKEVFLQGLSKLRNAALKAYKLLDPLTRLGAAKDRIATRFYQMDVYKEGDDSPVLVGKRFAAGVYFKRNEAGELVVLQGWNEIDGPVYTAEGEVIITREEYDRGLKTSMGVSINKMQDATKKLSRFGLDLFNKVKDRVSPAASDAIDRAKNAFKMEYAPIVNSVDRIYHLLLRHWGYDPDDTVPMPPPEPKPGEDGSADPAPGDAAPTPEPTPTPGPTPRPNPTSDPTPAPGPKPKTEQDHKDENKPLPRNPSIKPKTRLEEEMEKVGERTLNRKPVDRLNSNKDRADQAKEKKSGLVQDAIIGIADKLGFAGDGQEGSHKKESTGLFGLLMSGFGGITKVLGGIAGFFMKTLFGGFKTLFNFAGLGLKVFPILATGITAVAKGIVTLIKTRSLMDAGGSVMDTIRGRRGPPRPPRPPRTAGSRFMTGGKLLGAGMAIDMAGGFLKDVGVVDEGSIVDKAIDTAGTVSDVAGVYQLAAGAATMAGYSLSGGLMAAAGTVGGWLAAGAGAAATVLLSPWVLGAAAVGATAYGVYRYVNRGKGKQQQIRMAQYGVSDPESALAEKLLKAEEMMKDHIVIGNGRASFSKNSPIQQVMELFVTDPKNKKEIGDVFTWFNGRVKPVMLTYMACLDAVKMKSLQEYDESQSQDVYKVAKQVQQALVAVTPMPYSITAKVDADTPILDERATLARVQNLMEDLKEYIDRKTDSKDLEGVETLTYQSKGSLEKEKLQLESQLKTKGAFGEGDDAERGEKRAKTRLAAIDTEIGRLNTSYKASATVQEVYVRDLLPEGKAMDLLTAIRVAAYGNTENVTWRVEAVLKLERYCEQFFKVNGDKVTFTGQIGDLFNLFKGSFRAEKGDADDWCLWFRDRFLPVLTNYVQAVNHYRRGKPGVVWMTLSATARFEIAQRLINSQVEGFIFNTDIWNVRASPFPGTVSPAKPESVARMLKLLEEVSTVAKLKDPEAEAGKTNASTWAKTVAPHKVGGGFQPEAPNLDTVDKAKSRKDVVLGGQFGTEGGGSGNTYGAGGVMTTPANKYGFIPIKGATDTSHLDMTGVQQKGDDKGVSVPKKLAQQIIIREMLKQGFTDPRHVAEMLALTEYESQGYSRTTENMKYTTPAQLVKMFREVKDVNQAKQLIDAGEVAIANTVYGGGKGASIGNTAPGDGWKYRGRGFIQLTGKANYAKTGRELGIDLENKPELASNDPNAMAAIAVNFFKNSKQLQSISQTGNFGEAAKGLNGGNELPGMPARYQLYLQYLEKLNKGELGADGDTSLDSGGSSAAGTTATSMYGTPPANDPSAGGGAGAPAGAPSAPVPGGAPAAAGGGGGGGGGGSQGPMMGSPNMPSMIDSSKGGSGGGGGGYSPGGDNSPLVNSNADGAAGLRLKSGEAVAGGAAHPGIKRLCQIIQQRVPGFKYFSALNDAYHVNKRSKGGHPKGLAADFTLTNGIAGSDTAAGMVTEILRQANLTPAEFIVINEYRKKTADGTGGHIHAGFRTPAAAQKFLEASGGTAQSGEDTTGGGMVAEKGEQEAPNREQPSVPPKDTPAANEAPAEPGMTPGNGLGTPTSNNASDPFVTSPTPQAPQQSAPVTQAPPPPPVERAVPPPAPVAQDNSDLVKAIEAARDAIGGASTLEQQALQAILQQLIQLNKNGTPAPNAVKMN